MDLIKNMQFQGTWRTYQKRVLDHAEEYVKDGHIHIVAAPGSGKTTLGIELIRRLGKPALILTRRLRSGSSGRDKDLFARCMKEFFEPIDNQRYLLYKKHWGKHMFYVVPEIFAKNREDAEAFAKCMKSCMGRYELVYTRSVEGRKQLLLGRKKAFANREDRCIRHKKVKSALE